MSRTSADPGAGGNRQYRGPASVTTGMRKQLERSKSQNCEAARSERDFEETPAIPFRGRWRFAIPIRCGERAQRNNAARAKARPAKWGAQGKGKKQERGR